MPSNSYIMEVHDDATLWTAVSAHTVSDDVTKSATSNCVNMPNDWNSIDTARPRFPLNLLRYDYFAYHVASVRRFCSRLFASGSANAAAASSLSSYLPLLENWDVWRSMPHISVLLLTFFAYSSNYGSRRSISYVKPYMVKDWGMTAISLAWMDAAFSMCHSLGQLFIHYGIEKVWGQTSNYPLLLLFSLSSFVLLFIGWIRNEILLILLWGINGVFTAPLLGIFVSCVTPHIPVHRRAFTFGVWSTSQYFGSFFTAAILMLCLQRLKDWSCLFYILSACNCLAGVILFCFIPQVDFQPRLLSRIELVDKAHATDVEDSGSDNALNSNALHSKTAMNQQKLRTHIRPKNEPLGIKEWTASEIDLDSAVEEGEARGSVIHTSKEKQPQWMEIFYIPDICFSAVAFLFIKLVRYSLLNWISYFMVAAYHYDASVASSIAVAFDAGGFVGCVTAGIIADTALKGERILTITCYTIAGSLFLILFVFFGSRSTAVIIAFLFIIGACLAGPDAQLSLTVSKDICDKWSIPPSLTVAVHGLINGCGSLGGVTQSYLTATISLRYGWDAVFIMHSCLLTIAGLLLFATLSPPPKQNRVYLAN